LATANFYKALGLRRDADAAVVDAAYRSLAKKYHPDTADLPKNKAAEKFRLVQEAYETLRDPAKRAAYDEQLKAESKTSRKSEPKFHKRDDEKKEDSTIASAKPGTNWEPKLPYAAVALAAAIVVSFGISQFGPQWAVPVVSKDNDPKWPTVLQDNKGSIAPADQNNGASVSNSDETGPSQVSKQIYDRRVGEAELLAGQPNQPEPIPVRPLSANGDNHYPEINV
jgi:curved DNA-binding protein CbpA